MIKRYLFISIFFTSCSSMDYSYFKDVKNYLETSYCDIINISGGGTATKIEGKWKIKLQVHTKFFFSKRPNKTGPDDKYKDP